MTDERDEAVEAMADAMLGKSLVLSGKLREELAFAALDALTKPRTEKCEECAGSGYDSAPSDWPDEYTHENGPGPCQRCQGSGTVTRGPIAVLVPPDAVEIMARAMRNRGLLGARMTDLATLALDALYRRTGEA